MSLLKASQLQKSYAEKGRTVCAVRDVSLEVRAGEVLAFLGPNGAGKTTTIKMIAGLIRPDAGWVRTGERDPHLDSRALRLLGAVLEGNRNVYWRLTPEENLEYFGVLRGLSAAVARQRGRDLLERFNLGDKRQTRVDRLSRGMQQKLAIAVALIHQPQLLLLDEPTLGLDVEATEDVKQLVRKIAQEGCGIILTTHQLAIAEELSHRVAIINKGEIVVEEPTDVLIRQFSDTTYQIELETPLDSQRQSQLVGLGVDFPTAQTLRLAQQEALYSVLEILKPLPLVRVYKEQANLTDVFLKLVRQDRDV